MIQQSPLQSSTETQQQPLITVITVSFNAVKTIEQTMLSVLNQTYPNIEYIIIDGGSTDGTVDIIKKYADRLAYWVSEPDKGIYDAMNKGIDKATGEWINFKNSGDDFYNNHVLKYIFEKRINDKIDLLYGDLVLKFESINKQFKVDCHNSYINHPTLFCRTYLMKKYKFNTKYQIAADTNFINTIKSNTNCFYIPICVSFFDKSGLSSSKMIDSYKETLMIQKRANKNFTYIKLYIHSFFRYILPKYIYEYMEYILLKIQHKGNTIKKNG